MSGLVHREIVVETIKIGVETIQIFIPSRNFHGDLRHHDRLLAAPPQACSESHAWLVLRQLEIRSRILVGSIRGVVELTSNQTVERNQSSIVKEMINARGTASTISRK